MLAKTSASTAETKVKRPKTEHAEQARTVAWIRTFMPKVLLFAVPNGAAVSPIQRMRLLAEGLLPGVPDLFVAQPAGPYAGLFIEMKRSVGGVISPAQQKVMAALEERGYCVIVCTSRTQVITNIQKYINLN